MENKKNPPLKKKNLTVFFLFFLFFTFLLKVSLCEATVGEPEINYSDRDYITTKVEPEGKEYKINIESKEGGAVDWMGYVSQLNSEIFTSPSHFYESVKNNGTFYPDEGKSLGLVYGEAKSFFRYFDVLSNALSWASNKIFGEEIKKTVSIPSDKENIYLIRSYSGGWGKLVDSDEKSFVREKIFEGQKRDNQATAFNIAMVTIDTLGIFISFTDFHPTQLNEIAEAGLLEASRSIFYPAPPDLKDLLRTAVKSGEAMVKEAIRVLKKEAGENFFKFVFRKWKLVLDLVDVPEKISKAGKVADRITQMITIATPLETSYILVGNPLLALEKETEETLGLLEKGGPAALEETIKPAEKNKEEPTKAEKEETKITAFVKNQHGEAVPEANFWLIDEKGKEYTRRSTTQTGYLEIDTASLPKGEYTLHIEKVSWSGLTNIPYCDPYEKKITIGEQDISLGTITIHKWSKITAKIVDEAGSPTCRSCGFEVIDKEGHSPNYYPTYPSHWGGVNEYGRLETNPLPDGEYILRIDYYDYRGGQILAEKKVNISGTDVFLGEIIVSVK